MNFNDDHEKDDEIEENIFVETLRWTAYLLGAFAAIASFCSLAGYLMYSGVWGA